MPGPDNDALEAECEAHGAHLVELRERMRRTLPADSPLHAIAFRLHALNGEILAALRATTNPHSEDSAP